MIEKIAWSEIIFGAFCVIALIQIVYYLYFFRRLAFYPNNPTWYAPVSNLFPLLYVPAMKPQI